MINEIATENMESVGENANRHLFSVNELGISVSECDLALYLELCRHSHVLIASIKGSH